MRTWNPSTQCVSCCFQAYLRQVVRTSKFRTSHGSPSARNYVTVEQTRPRSDLPQNPKTYIRLDLGRKKPEKRSSPPTEPDRKGSKVRLSPLIRKTSETLMDRAAERIRYRNRILESLEVHQRWIKSDVESLPPELHFLKLADPGGEHWEKYYEVVKELVKASGVEKIKTGFELTDDSLVGRMFAAAKGSPLSQDIYRELQYGFIDHIISAGSATLSKGQFKVDLQHPTEWFPRARMIQRQIHLHVGPTNSGKTYNALKRLEQAQDGFYAGPLRLLAHEVYSRFNDRGITCDLVTGDDIRLNEGVEVKLYSSTVEMVDIDREQEVGVIDEIQMMSSEDRGWAWTRALLGASVKELHLCGETRVVPLIREIVASMGDTLHIHQYERLNPLKVMSRSLGGDLKNLRKGDCVVSFSIVGIHALKRQIEVETGKRVAIVYGSLPPETRARQAALFNDPDNDYDYLVASDAIGMGLNLSIKRVVFETTMKWNGRFQERLSISQIKQIAGRAGRYRTSQDDKAQSKGQKARPATSIGLVTCLDEADIPTIQHALNSDAPPLKRAGLLPTGEEYEAVSALLPRGIPFEYIMRRVFNSSSLGSRFQLCDTKDNLSIARVLDAVPGLQLRDRLVFCAAPAIVKGRQAGRQDEILLAMARVVAESRPITVVDLIEIPLEVLDNPASADREYLESLEILHKSLILYLWLSYRFPQFFRDQDMAMYAKALTEEKINETLVSYSANPVLRRRLLEMKKTSELMREKLKESGALVDSADRGSDRDEATEEADAVMTNPDATVEEVERRAKEEEEREEMEKKEKERLALDNGDEVADGGDVNGQPLVKSAPADSETFRVGGSVEETMEPNESKAIEEMGQQVPPQSESIPELESIQEQEQEPQCAAAGGSQG